MQRIDGIAQQVCHECQADLQAAGQSPKRSFPPVREPPQRGVVRGLLATDRLGGPDCGGSLGSLHLRARRVEARGGGI